MAENMTDKQMDVILNLVADKFSNCKDMDEVAKPCRKSETWPKRKAC